VATLRMLEGVAINSPYSLRDVQELANRYYDRLSSGETISLSTSRLNIMLGKESAKEPNEDPTRLVWDLSGYTALSQ